MTTNAVKTAVTTKYRNRRKSFDKKTPHKFIVISPQASNDIGTTS